MFEASPFPRIKKHVLPGHSTAGGQVSAARLRTLNHENRENRAGFTSARPLLSVGTMPQSSSVTFTRRTFSSALRARAAAFAPVVSAALSLSSFAHAEPPPENAASVDAPAPLSASPSPVAPPSAPSAPVSADRSPPPPARVREGFYLRLGSGPSVASLSGHGPSGSASILGAGESGFIAIGGAVLPGLVLAGTVQGTSITSEFKGGPFIDATVTSNGKTRSASHKAEGGIGMVGLLLDWYPKPKAGWHAGIATGIGAVGLTNLADDSSFGGVNLGGSVFGGYDWALGRAWALGLQLTASGATSTKLLEGSGAHDTGYRLTPVSFGVQASVLYF
jgi:hypothetical protein